MRKLFFYAGLIVVALLLSTGAFRSAQSAPAAKQAVISAEPESKVAAYYFHGNFRCVTCRRIEQYSKEAVETNFAPQLKDKKLEFRPINVEQKGNEHYIQDYQLYTRSLVLVLFRNGQQIKWKNLDGVWQHAGDREKFHQYVKGEIESFLKAGK